jgi:hypothetical protein
MGCQPHADGQTNCALHAIGVVMLDGSAEAFEDVHDIGDRVRE